ncbi:MAG: transposase family protein [Gammaproteobacteria bacterium]|nr:transposase family protein [Gammaproteobacteria bacterium]MBT7209309.1 transposase family protein [Gammaproteobacteria bacterium]
MSNYRIEAGDVVMIRGHLYKCNGRGPGGKHIFTSQKNRSTIYLSPEEIYEYFAEGKFKKIDQSMSFPILNDSPHYQFDLSSLVVKERRDVMDRLHYMKGIQDHYQTGGKLSNRSLEPALEALFKELKKKNKEDGVIPPQKPMSCSSAKRWFKAWKESGCELITLVKERRGNSTHRLSLEIRDVIDDVINTDYLSPLRITAKKAYRKIVGNIQVLNKQRKKLGLHEMKAPSYATVLNHINQVDEYDKLSKRHGAVYAAKATRAYGMTPPVNRVLERVQMDHTQLDVFVDMGQEQVIRPYLTLALDAHSKAILGYWLSINPPSADTVMNCLRVAILPKDIIAMGGNKDWQYPMHGIPIELTLDNGKDFHSLDLEMACAQLGITMNFTPPRKPYYKAQVERKFGEINTSLLTSMPGRVYKDDPEKRDDNYPFLTLDETNNILLQWICTILHETPSSTTGLSPLKTWIKSVNDTNFNNNLSNSPFDADTLSITLGKTISNRKLCPDGISNENLRYNSETLSRYRRSLAKPHGKNPSVSIKWNASDVGVIWVLDEKQNRYFQVPALQQESHGRSLFTHKVIQREIRAQIKSGLSKPSYIDAEIAIDKKIQEVTKAKSSKSKSKVGRYKAGKPRNKIPLNPVDFLETDDFIEFDTDTGEVINALPTSKKLVDDDIKPMTITDLTQQDEIDWDDQNFTHFEIN